VTRRNASLAAAAILISVVAIFIGWWIGQGRKGPTDALGVDEPEQAIIEGEMMTAQLFFPGPSGRLFPAEREIPIHGELLGQLELILEELLVGPVGTDLFPALPPEITVEWLHLSPAGILYVDLKYTGEAAFPAWGSRQEILAVYSLVNTLLGSAPEISAVVLLRNGQQRSTFAGHLDTSRPLITNRQLVASR
jgi:hypothetical protein